MCLHLAFSTQDALVSDSQPEKLNQLKGNEPQLILLFTHMLFLLWYVENVY